MKTTGAGEKETVVCVAKLSDVQLTPRVLKVSRSIHRAGYHCVVVGLPTRKSLAQLHNDGVIFTLAHSRFDQWGGKLARPARVLEKFLSYTILLWKTQAKVYCVHDVISMALVGVFSIFRKVRIIYLGDELEYARSYPGLPGRLRNIFVDWFLRWGLRFCDVVMQADISRASALSAKYQLRDVRVLRNLPEKIDGIDPIDIKSELGWPKDTIIAIYHGSLGEGRGIDIAMNALAAVADKKCSVGFVMIGWGSEQFVSRLCRCVHDAHRRNPYFFGSVVGPVDSKAIWKWIAGADIGVVLIENTSLSYYLAAASKLYENMMAGVPVLVSDFPENKMVIERAKCGILIDPRNEKAVVDAFRTLCSNKNMRDELGASGKQYGKLEYNWEKEEVVLISAINEVLGTK